MQLTMLVLAAALNPGPQAPPSKPTTPAPATAGTAAAPKPARVTPAPAATAAAPAPAATTPARGLKTRPAPESAGLDGSPLEAGLAAFKKRHFTQAEAEFTKAMEADPSNAAPVFYLAYTYYKLAEPKRPFHPDKQKAKEMFAKAFEMDPNFRPVWGSHPAPPAEPAKK